MSDFATLPFFIGSLMLEERVRVEYAGNGKLPKTIWSRDHNEQTVTLGEPWKLTDMDSITRTWQLSERFFRYPQSSIGEGRASGGAWIPVYELAQFETDIGGDDDMHGPHLVALDAIAEGRSDQLAQILPDELPPLPASLPAWIEEDMAMVLAFLSHPVGALIRNFIIANKHCPTWHRVVHFAEGAGIVLEQLPMENDMSNYLQRRETEAAAIESEDPTNIADTRAGRRLARAGHFP